MKSTIAIGVLLMAATAAFAGYQKAASTGFAHWTAKELKGYEKPLHEKVAGEHRTSGVKLGDYGSSNVALSHREANGIPEVHAQMDDYFIVQSGEADLMVGGEVVNAKVVEPNETRGDAIKGGEKKRLLPGDIVHIPAGMPHQLLVEKGKLFTYFVIKVKAN
jgi:mannose-6-phosphate isomerase-like protein (cupin superfamily)